MVKVDSFLERIKQASEYNELFALHQEMQGLIRRLQSTDKTASASWICLQISSWHDQLIRQVIVLAKQQLMKQLVGAKLPPFNFMLFGSSAREEPTFWTDQDNGLIYLSSEQAKTKHEEVLFQELGKLIVDGLHQAGYPLCKGNVMASSREWRYSQGDWQERVKRCIENPSLENVRFLMIAADARSVYGDQQLTNAFHRELLKQLRVNRTILEKSWQFIDQQPFPLGIFHNWIQERYGENAGRVQLKRGGYYQLVGVLRLFSIRFNILETSSRKRIDRLAELHPFFTAHHQQIRQSLDTFLSIRLAHHLQIGNIRHQPEDYIQINNELTQIQQIGWKKAIDWVKKMKKAWRKQWQKDRLK